MSIGFYEVRAGDQLNRILMVHYGPSILHDEQAMAFVLASNPDMRDPDRITPGQVVILPEFGVTQSPGSGAVDGQTQQSCLQIAGGLSRISDYGRSFIGSLTEDIWDSSAGGFVDVVKDATTKAIPEAKKIVRDYYRKESGMITENQRKYRRTVSVKRVEKALGPLHHLINPGKDPAEVLRIKPKATHRTSKILSEVSKLERISKVAKGGGIVLGAVSLAGTTVEIINAPSDQDRTVIAIEAGGKLLGGAALVFGVGLMFTPVGWVGFAVMAGVSVVGGAAGGTIANAIAKDQLFDQSGNRVDVAADGVWKHLKW